MNYSTVGYLEEIALKTILILRHNYNSINNPQHHMSTTMSFKVITKSLMSIENQCYCSYLEGVAVWEQVVFYLHLCDPVPDQVHTPSYSTTYYLYPVRQAGLISQSYNSSI